MKQRQIKFRAWNGFEMNNAIEAGILNPTICGYKAVMQFTGLLDKNGNEIYEGDIVETGLYGKCTVIWPEKYVCDNERNEDILAWCIDPIDAVKYHGIYGLDVQSGYEIIGNIYQNPDLLK